MKPILITGATGFTGWHLTRSLRQDGLPVRVLVRPESKRDHLDSLGVDIALGDLRDPASIERAVSGCGTVYHIAAAYRDSSMSDEQMTRVNKSGAQALLLAADIAGVTRFVHCSTIGVHGDVKDPPANETSAMAPGDGYQRSKLAGEEIVQRFRPTQGMEIVVFRPCAIYGPGDLRFLKLFRSIAKRRFVMIGNGKALYHLVYIDDLVHGIRLCGTRPEAAGETFIIGGPTYSDLNTMTRTVADILEVSPPWMRLPFAPVYAASALCEALCKPLGIEPPIYRRRCDFFRKNRAFDLTKAQTVLGYEPNISMEEGLRRTAEWYRSAGHL